MRHTSAIFASGEPEPARLKTSRLPKKDPRPEGSGQVWQAHLSFWRPDSYTPLLYLPSGDPPPPPTSFRSSFLCGEPCCWNGDPMSNRPPILRIIIHTQCTISTTCCLTVLPELLVLLQSSVLVGTSVAESLGSPSFEEWNSRHPPFRRTTLSAGTVYRKVQNWRRTLSEIIPRSTKIDLPRWRLVRIYQPKQPSCLHRLPSTHAKSTHADAVIH